MAISKLNKIWKNKGSWKTGDPTWNAATGQQITDTIDALIDFSSKMINAGDFDDAIDNGFYIMRGGCANSPIGENATVDSHFYLITIQYSMSYIIQLCTSIFTNDNNFYFRKKNGGNWKDWHKFSGTSKTGTFTNPDATIFEVTDSRIVQRGNTVDVTLNLKLLKEVAQGKQYTFRLAGVDFPSKEFITLGVSSGSSYTAGNFLYTYLNSGGHLALKCNTATCAAGGSWYVHLTYLID